MRRSLFSNLPFWIAPLALTVLLLPRVTHAQTTVWNGSVSTDWGTAANWSNGEPTASVDAEVPNALTPTVSLAGEVCRNLTTGISGSGSLLKIQGGSLNVVQRFHLGSGVSGTALHTFGSVTAGELRMGNLNAAAANTMSGGTLTLGTAQISTNDVGAGATFTMTAGNPICTITGALRIAPGGSFGCGAGTLNVGTNPGDGTFVDGVFILNNTPTVTMKGFTLSGTSTLLVGVGPFSAATIVVNGTATLDGTLLVNDIVAPNGTYEVVRGNPLQGTFDSVMLPANFSIRIENNSLFITKGEVAVEPTSWSRIKAGSAR